MPPSEGRTWRDLGIRTRLSFALQQEGSQKDVTFRVGPSEEIVSAHRLILSLSSTYFNNLISTGITDEIRLPDVCPHMFKRLLKFIYTDEIDHEKFALFLDLAITFGFHHLHEICLDSALKSGIAVENVVFVLGLATYGENSDFKLRETCLNFIKRNVAQVLAQESFNELSQQDLGNLMDSNDFVIDGGEYSLFSVVLNWAKYQIRGKGAETADSLRNVLGDLRFKVRYTQIPYDKLLSAVKPSGLLTSAEFLQVLKIYIDPDQNTLGIFLQPRNTRGESNNKLQNELPNNDPAPVSLEQNNAQKSTHDYLTRAPSLKKIITPRSDQLVLRDNSPEVVIVTDLNPPDGIVEYEQIPCERECIPPQIELGQLHHLSYCVPVDIGSSPAELIFINCTVEWGYLMSAIQYKQSTLIRIVLKNVEIVNFFKENVIRMFLPRLESFHFFKERDPHNLMPSIPDKTIPYYLDTKGFLFFEKSVNTGWLFSQLPRLGVDIHVHIDGINLMSISPSKHKIILSFPPDPEIDFMLDNCPDNTKSLNLCGCTIKTPGRIPKDQLEQLTLYGVTINGMTAARFMNYFSALRHISLYEIPQNDYYHYSQLHIASDLKKCRAILESLSLTKASIFSVTEKCLQKDFTPFVALEELYFNCCNWNADFPGYFKKMFPSLKRFGIRWECKHTACVLLKEILVQCKGLELLAISRHCGVLEAESSSPDEAWVQAFLTAAVGHSYPAACLDNLLFRNLVLRKINGVWGMIRGDDAAQIHFQALKLDHFFSDVGMLNFITL